MHPLSFALTWLLGASSAGNKEARAALTLFFPAVIGALSWDLEQLRQGVVNNNPGDINSGLFGMLGKFTKNANETCTDTVIRFIREEAQKQAYQAVVANFMQMNDEKILPLLEDVIASIKAKASKDAKENQGQKTSSGVGG